MGLQRRDNFIVVTHKGFKKLKLFVRMDKKNCLLDHLMDHGPCISTFVSEWYVAKIGNHYNCTQYVEKGYCFPRYFSLAIESPTVV